jgi:RimJ/RimL family protein N-acetyltransferase
LNTELNNPQHVRLLVHAVVKTRRGTAALRDLNSEDVDAIARYWFTSSEEFLDFMGIDRKRLGTMEDTRQRFLRAVRTGDSNQQSFALAITLDDEFIGYTLLNRYAPEANYSHWHITNPDLRGTGISSILYPHRIKTYFDLVPIERLTHQTRTRNIAVNRMLDKYVPVSQTCQIEKPDGVALPGEFNLRYVFRRDIEKFFARAVELHGAA